MLAGLAVGALALAGATVADPPVASSLGKVKCHQTTGTAKVDPIVHHNRPVGSAHLHQFFGNNAFLSLPNPNTANYLDLMGRGTNCENAADTAGYWAPTLHNTRTGAVVPVASFTAYYRSWNGRTTGAGLPHPADTRLVASADYDWTCGQKERVEPSTSIPDCSRANGGPGSRLTAHVTFPTCWDGVLPVHRATDVGNTSDNAHYAYRLSKEACPAGFPVKVVELRITISWAYTGSGSDVALSSDSHMGTSDGRSLHADFWNTWVQAGYTTMVRDCINPGLRRGSARCG